MTACCALSQPFYLDGHKAVHEGLNNIWLCSIPQEKFDTDWIATIVCDSTWTDITVSGVAVPNGGQVIFEGIKGNKKYPFSATTDDGIISGNITFTWLPVIELNGDFGMEYVEGTVSINGPDSTARDDMRAKLKWRGHYSNEAGKHKRNYHIKFLDKDGDKKNRTFYGMRKDNHWKLDAGQADRLRIRNRVANDLWLDMARKPWYQDLEPELINGSRGQETEVILNGNYRGIYGLIEPVDRKQLKLVKLDTVANEIHGQLWFSRNWCRTATMSDPKPWDNSKSMWDGIEADYPDFEEVSTTDWSTLANAITFVKNIDTREDWDTFNDSVGHYFDIPVVMDYFIFIISLQAVGNESINIYYSTYDKMLDCPLTVTAWDLDNTVGSKHFSNWTSDLYSPERPITQWISNLLFYELFYNSKYRQPMVARYWELRKTWLNTDNLIARYQRAVDEIKGCGAAAREEALWSGDSDIYGRTLNFDEEMSYVANWIRQRMTYIDNNIFSREELLLGDINFDCQIDISDVTSLIAIVLDEPDEIDELIADLDGDGSIDIKDVTALISMVLNN